MGLEFDLRNEQVKHLDLSKFVAVKSGTAVRTVVAKMRDQSKNCALITQNNKLIGIFTDRDILRKVVSYPEVWDKPVDEVMSTSPFTLSTDRQAEKALSLMNEKHFRNVPVLNSEGTVVGNLTHYALIKYLADHFPESVYNLPPEPDQIASDRVGG